MGCLDYHLPVLAMFLLQFIYASVSLTTRVALLQGLRPSVYVVYRQAFATVVIAPIAFFSSRKHGSCSLNLRSFGWIFLASLIGVTINQNVYFEGLYLVPSSIASATSNLIPAVTFVMAAFTGIEKVDFRSLQSMAKIAGTVICVAGAMMMAFLRGPKLLNADMASESNRGGSGDENWLLGCLCLFGSCCLWSLWLILQVPIFASHPNHLSFSAWMCFMSTLQSAAVTLFLEPTREAWKLHSMLEFGCTFYSGVAGSALAFFVQAWSVSKRGPLFSALFNPLCTVIVNISAALFLHEKIYTGSLIGSIGVIMGLYIVLWGKAEDVVEETEPKLQINSSAEDVVISEGKSSNSEETCCKIDLEEPLLQSAK